ncbi:MAG: HEPN domain-containing protein [Saprospiraceae bacterium]
MKYRLDRARETFSEAEILLAEQKLFATVNRLYYAAFYAISAYFVQQELKAFTHAGLKNAFNKELILSGKIDPEEGRLFNQLFSFRQDADYKDFVQFEHEQVIGLVPKVKILIDHLEELIVGN